MVKFQDGKPVIGTFTQKDIDEKRVPAEYQRYVVESKEDGNSDIDYERLAVRVADIVKPSIDTLVHLMSRVANALEGILAKLGTEEEAELSDDDESEPMASKEADIGKRPY